MSTNQKIDYRSQLPDAFKHLMDVHRVIAETGLDTHLAHLVMLRASQINGCAFCVAMHVADARKAGETDQRLDQLIVWRHVEAFHADEKAALEWVESLTRLNNTVNCSEIRQNLRKHFSDRHVTAITLLVGMINLWNRIGISNH